MTGKFAQALAERDWLLADGATGTNYFAMGLVSGESPENWNESHPGRVRDLHRAFIEAGADIILTNSFGGNRRRMMMHGAADRVREINALAARHARAEADAAGRPVIVAGSIGPTGDLLEPLGELPPEEARAAFAEQAEALAEGGADILWCETLSAENEVAAAVEACAATGLPVVATMSFDTGGRTMMGIKPGDWPRIAAGLPGPLAAFGANCGVGAAELVATVLGIAASAPPESVIVAKANCGMPELTDDGIRYNGTPQLMADYARLSRNAGARIIGGCCGTTPGHLAAMRQALEAHRPGPPPTIDEVIASLGTVSRLARGVDAAADARLRGKRPDR